jgi:HEAT repeat protein
LQEPADVAQCLQLLTNPSEQARSDAVLKLGRLKVQRAVDPLAATLAGDASPAVRETAARALGLIGSPRALAALCHAAQADADRDVRRSAQFAVEIIQTNQPH